MSSGPQPARPGARPTLETVAGLADVSPATVSRVVDGDTHVRPEHRAAVEEAIASVGFVRNRAACSLATRRNDSVALVLREPAEFGVVDPYLASLMIGVTQALVGSGLQLVMLTAADEEDHRRTADYLRGHVDGAILVSVHDDDPLPSELAGHGMAMVFAERPRAGRRCPSSTWTTSARPAPRRSGSCTGGAAGSRRSPGPPT